MKERKQYEPVIVKFRDQTINEIYVSDIINYIITLIILGTISFYGHFKLVQHLFTCMILIRDGLVCRCYYEYF